MQRASQLNASTLGERGLTELVYGRVGRAAAASPRRKDGLPRVLTERATMSVGRYELIALLILVVPSVSLAECLAVVCNGDSTELRITINRQDPPPEPGTELVVIGAPLGSCEPPALLTPEGIPFINPEPFVGFETYVVTIATPFDGAATRYQLQRRYLDGSTGPPSSCGDPLPVDTEGCSEEWHVGRGRVTGILLPPEVPSPRLDYTFCTDACWIELPLVIATNAIIDDVTIGDFVDIYGTMFESGMPGESRIDVSRIIEIDSPGDCGVVASDGHTWGSLKAQFK